MKYFVGVDLGQAADYTALCVLEKIQDKEKQDGRSYVTIPYSANMLRRLKPRNKPMYHLRHMERPRLGTPYTDIVKRTRQVVEALPAVGTALIIDATGCGRPVFDMFTNIGLKPVGISIHGGSNATRDGAFYNVPKRDLVGTLQVLFQSGRLKVAESLPEAQTLIDELLNFKVKVNIKTAHDSYEAWREGTHDDLVLAVALAAWYAEKRKPVARALGAKPAGW